MSHGCFNRAPFVAGTEVQDGYYASGPRRKVVVPFRMATDCQFTHTELGQADKRCIGCKHKSTKPTGETK
jgi:hypothetical protein